MKTKLTFTLLATIGAMVTTSQASLVISSLDTTSTIDFTGFTGAGLAPSPAAGQLDSDTWRVLGLSDGDSTFGGTHTSGDFARGSDADGVNTGGVYAFDVDPSASVNATLGVQGAGSDFTPGSFTLRIQNTTGGTVTGWNLSYALYVLNNEARSNSWNWSWSTDDSSYTPISTYTSVEAAAGSPAWSNVENPSVSNLNASVANNGFLYLQWSSDDVGGSNNRDEFAIDNISVTAVPEPSAALFGGLGLLALLRRRR